MFVDDRPSSSSGMPRVLLEACSVAADAWWRYDHEQAERAMRAWARRRWRYALGRAWLRWGSILGWTLAALLCGAALWIFFALVALIAAG